MTYLWTADITSPKVVVELREKNLTFFIQNDLRVTFDLNKSNL